MFISAIDLTGEILLDILKGDGEFIARVPIGYDDDLGVVYSVFVALSPMIGYADIPGYELVFNITVAAIDESTVHACWDGRETRGFLTDAILRKQVLAIICSCIGTLIDEAKPNLVSMTTHTAHLPRAALTKFDRICAMLGVRGFIAGKADQYNGRYIWMMDRR